MAGGAPQPAGTRARIGAFLAILATVGLCYFGALGNHFAYDDHELVTGNDFLKGWMAGAPDARGRPVDYVGRMLEADFAALALRISSEVDRRPIRINYYRPVIALSYILDTGFWGEIEPWSGHRPLSERSTLQWTHLNPVGFHLTNVLFHAVSSLLVYAVALALVRSFWAALVAGVLFAAHPIHTESVTWIAGRTDVIATTFFLAAFWAYLRHRRRGSRPALAAALGLFLVGTFAKEMVAVLPFLLLLYELMRARHEARPSPGAAVRVAVFFGLIAPYFLMKSALTGDGGDPGPTAADMWTGTSFFTVLTTLPTAITWYFRKLLLPFRFNLYPMLEFVSPAAVGTWLPWLLAHAVLFGVALRACFARSRRIALAGFCVAGLYLSLAPLSCLIPGLRLARFEDIEFPVSERFLYIPSLLVVLLAAVGLGALVRRGRAGRPAVAALVALAVAGATWITHGRNREWSWNLEIFGATVRASPNSIRMRLNYGAALTNDVWRVREGRLQFERAQFLAERVRGHPAPPQLYNGLADSNYLRKELTLAARYLQRAFDLFDRPPEYGNRVAVTLSIYAAITGNPLLYHQAIDVFRHVLARAPGHALARASVGFAQQTLQVWDRYARTADRPDALVRDYARSFEISAGSLEEDEDPRRRLMALQVIDAGLERLPAAGALEALPETGQVRRLMVERAGRLHPDLVTRYGRLLERHPGRAALHFLLGEVQRITGTALDRADLLAEARRHYGAVVEAEPDHAEAAIGLALVLIRTGEAERALDVARRAAAELLREDRTWEDRPLAPRPTKAVAVATRIAKVAGDTPEGQKLVRETWERGLGVLERRARDEDAGRSWEAWNMLAVAEVEAQPILERPALLRSAIDHFRRAAELAPEAEPPLMNLIELYQRTGRHGDARATEAQLIELRRSRARRQPTHGPGAAGPPR